MDTFLSFIGLWPLNWAPRYWACCWVQFIDIRENNALFALLGTTCGGDGTSTFGIPDLRGRVLTGTGSGSGILPYPRGYMGGFERIPLNVDEIPVHNHNVVAAFSGGGAISGSATATIAISSTGVKIPLITKA